MLVGSGDEKAGEPAFRSGPASFRNRQARNHVRSRKNNDFAGTEGKKKGISNTKPKDLYLWGSDDFSTTQFLKFNPKISFEFFFRNILTCIFFIFGSYLYIAVFSSSDLPAKGPIYQ